MSTFNDLNSQRKKEAKSRGHQVQRGKKKLNKRLKNFEHNNQPSLTNQQRTWYCKTWRENFQHRAVGSSFISPPLPSSPPAPSSSRIGCSKNANTSPSNPFTHPFVSSFVHMSHSSNLGRFIIDRCQILLPIPNSIPNSQHPIPNGTSTQMMQHNMTRHW